MKRRKVYLAMKSLHEARELFFSRVAHRRTTPQAIDTNDALGRVTAEPVFAKLSSPTYHSAAMDGIAVKSVTTYGTSERRPKILRIREDALWVNTGQPLPQGFDAVIMVEKLHQLDDDQVEIRAPAYPWQNVRKVGEDIIASQLLLPQNHRIRAIDIGALLSGGIFSIKVWTPPKVAIIPSGSELVDYRDVRDGRKLEPGEILESNSSVLAAMVRENRGLPVVYELVPDEPSRIKEALKKAVKSDADIIIVNAGSSAGTKDYTADAIEELGEVLVHGVAMMPGKPTILGLIEDKPVVGNPGYSVSSALSFDQFVKPLLYSMQGIEPPEPKRIRVRPTRDIPSKLGIEEFLRVSIGKVGERYVATPLARAAGSITTLTRAEGIIRIPELSEGISQEEEVEAELLVKEKDLLNTVVFIGSHDMTIDIIADEIRGLGKGIRISSSNVGSLGGLLALRKRTCHLCGSHLLDTQTGEYNLSYIRKYLKGLPVAVFHLVKRQQGLIVAKGNPKRIQGLEDLAREDVSFVNRQPGSGTRVLLDFKLEQAGIDPRGIRGYDHEEFTHMAVAVDVVSGAADCGMGIYAAAKALDLDFIPIESEQYDLVIPLELLDQPNIQAVLERVRSEPFRKRVKSLGGYDPSKSGELFAEVT
ncbi:MAG: molybdopterin biosynthesis protein [Deltaproteobacteria bacterium]|nr:MAG: molybdopterin biosynthesis protein [Deltaproteobacteria bacterium]